MISLLFKKHSFLWLFLAITFGIMYSLSYKAIYIDVVVPIESKMNQYEDSKFDYIFTDMAIDQFDELKNDSSIEQISPVLLFDDIPFDNGIKYNMMFFKNIEDMSISFFNEKRIIHESKKVIENPLFITIDIAKEYNFVLEDKIQIMFGDQQKILEFTVAGIYQSSDVFSKRYQIAGLWNEELAEAYTGDLYYNVVFIDISSELFVSNAENYVPMAHAPKPSEYTTEELYLEKLNEYLNQDFSNFVIDKTLKIEHLQVSYQSVLVEKENHKRMIIVFLNLIILAVTLLCYKFMSNNRQKLYKLGLSRKTYVQYLLLQATVLSIIYLLSVYLSLLGIQVLSYTYISQQNLIQFILLGLSVMISYGFVSFWTAMGYGKKI